jgi:hypothetical protein
MGGGISLPSGCPGPASSTATYNTFSIVIGRSRTRLLVA